MPTDVKELKSEIAWLRGFIARLAYDPPDSPSVTSVQCLKALGYPPRDELLEIAKPWHVQLLELANKEA